MDARTRWAVVVILAALAIAIVIAAVAGSAHAGSPAATRERSSAYPSRPTK